MGGRSMSAIYEVVDLWTKLLGVLSFLTSSADVVELVLTGTLPEGLCDIPRLSKLLLQYTSSLTGTIPDCLAQPSMRLLGLQGNRLGGTLPPGLELMTSLEALILNDNHLTGAISSSFGSRFTELQSLYLYNNSLTGSLGNSLCTPGRKMRYFVLGLNRFSSTIPPCFGEKFTSLVVLDLDTNAFSASIPETICGLGEGLEQLLLGSNSFSSTIPTCLGKLMPEIMDLGNNHFEGTVPRELCLGSQNMQYLALDNNFLSGTLPSCFGSSFQVLRSLIIHANDIHGSLPGYWNNSLLETVVASNNRHLSGPLPASLFTQGSLQSLVLEGTGVSGTLPLTVCEATGLAILVLSGNELSGSVPFCVGNLGKLTRFEMSSNELEGELPHSLGDLASLQFLDLSQNKIRGRVPSSLGDMSMQLKTTKLDLNRLSCDLPKSVLHWKKAPAFRRLDLLTGSLFGCPDTKSWVLGQRISSASGLSAATDTESYRCGASAFEVAAWIIAAVVAPIALLIIAAWFRGMLRFDLAAIVFVQCASSQAMLSGPTTCAQGLINAGNECQWLAGSVWGIVLVSLLLVLPVLLVAPSAYECTYNPPSFAYKESNRVLSSAAGAAVSLAIICGTIAWWRPWWKRRKCLFDSPEGGTSTTPEKGHAHDDNNIMFQYDDEKNESERKGRRHYLTLAAEFVFLLGVGSIGPNVAYVYATTSGVVPVKYQSISTLALGVVKVVYVKVFVPLVSNHAVALLSPGNAARAFDLRLLIFVATNAVSSIVVPIATVFINDRDCAYLYWHPLPREHTTLDVEVCAVTQVETGDCLEYSKVQVKSSYYPKFEYDGELCVSAVFEAYIPVLLVTVLLCAVLQAALEFFVVPVAAPWLHQRAAASAVARRFLELLRLLAWNVPTALPDVVLSADSWDYAAQRVIEAGIAGLLFVLLIALTFGLAAPLLALACGVASCVHVVNTKHVLAQVATVSTQQHLAFPDLKGCTRAPPVCGLVVVLTAVVFWGCGSVHYLDISTEGTVAALVFFTCAVIARSVVAFNKGGCVPTRHASTLPSLGVLQEALLFDDTGEEVHDDRSDCDDSSVSGLAM